MPTIPAVIKTCVFIMCVHLKKFTTSKISKKKARKLLIPINIIKYVVNMHGIFSIYFWIWRIVTQDKFG